MLAASISYFSMMAVLPFCLFLIAIFTYFLGHDEAFFNFFTAKLLNFFPKAAQQIARELRDALSYRGIGTFTFYCIRPYVIPALLIARICDQRGLQGQRQALVYQSSANIAFPITLLIIFFLLSFGASSTISVLNTFKNDIPGLQIHAITSLSLNT